MDMDTMHNNNNANDRKVAPNLIQLNQNQAKLKILAENITFLWNLKPIQNLFRKYVIPMFLFFCFFFIFYFF